MCVECLIGKKNKPTLFKVTEPSSVPYRTPCHGQAISKVGTRPIQKFQALIPGHEPCKYKLVTKLYNICIIYRPLGEKFPRHTDKNLNLRFCGKLSECPLAGVVTVLNTTSHGFRNFPATPAETSSWRKSQASSFRVRA